MGVSASTFQAKSAASSIFSASVISALYSPHVFAPVTSVVAYSTDLHTQSLKLNGINGVIVSFNLKYEPAFLKINGGSVRGLTLDQINAQVKSVFSAAVSSGSFSATLRSTGLAQGNLAFLSASSFGSPVYSDYAVLIGGISYPLSVLLDLQ